MDYISTRNTQNSNERISSAQAIKQGLANDGGLFMPRDIPDLSEDDLLILCGRSYPERTAFILNKFLTDYTYDELLEDCEKAYNETRFPGGAAPIKTLGDTVRMLELWHGPTAAFKDMALQIKPFLLSRALLKTGETRTAFILVATSGDTGKAALEGYADANGVEIMVFYPANGVSKIQKLQMVTQNGDNVHVCAVNGNFDDTQNGVKRIFSDSDAIAKLNEKGCFFSSANSINWGRLAPQIVYYISAYCDLINNGDIELGDEINVCVPTGNFGNIFAAYIAKQMGLPINHFVCASNNNNILTDFFNTGTYDRNRHFQTTMSPSMDILISSNLERLLYLTAGSERTALYMKQLADNGKYTIDEDVRLILDHNFAAYYCDEKNTAYTIKNTFKKHNYLCDTHTAVGLYCAEKYMNTTGDNRKMLVASTASPYKFAASVYNALTDKTLDNEFDTINALTQLTGVPVPYPLVDIDKRTVRFDGIIEADAMKNEILNVINR